MLGGEVLSSIRAVIEWAALGIEMLGAVVIVAGVVRVAITRGTVRYLFQLDRPGAYESYKHQIGRSLLLGLEFLVAGDVVRTVALEPTLINVGVLGLLVLIRTFLSWSLAVEIEGRWPWQARTDKDIPADAAKGMAPSCEPARTPDSGEALQ
jgi:uncharacterized membrane protein